jgi:hypothetical protein
MNGNVRLMGLFMGGLVAQAYYAMVTHNMHHAIATEIG